MMTPSQVSALNTLSYHQWKRPLDTYRELKGELTLSTTYIALGQLEGMGYVESKKEDGLIKFKKTNEGIRVGIDQAAKDSPSPQGLRGGFKPA